MRCKFGHETPQTGGPEEFDIQGDDLGCSVLTQSPSLLLPQLNPQPHYLQVEVQCTSGVHVDNSLQQVELKQTRPPLSSRGCG